MELKDLYSKKQDKKSLAVCGAQIVDTLRECEGKTFMELAAILSFPAEVVRASLNVLTKNGVLVNMLGKYVLEEGVGDFVVSRENRASNRTKYRAVVPAKMNLSLSIVGRGDKLHELDMFICPFDLVWDEAEYQPADDNSIVIVDNTMQPDFDADRFGSIIKSKVEKLLKKFNLTGKIIVKKGVPLGAGLGGSTAVLAAVYLALKKYAEENGKKCELTQKYLTSLSSDMPAMILGAACRVQGVGDKVTRIDENVKIKFVGFKIAEGGSDTAEVYKQFDEIAKISSAKPPQDVETALKIQRNDLYAPAVKLNKEIKKAYQSLKDEKPRFLLMSGSGSAIIALDYITQED